MASFLDLIASGWQRFVQAQSWPQARPKPRYVLLGLITLLLLGLTHVSIGSLPAVAQTGGSGGSGSSSSSDYSLGWVELDGRDAFQISAPGPALSQRRQNIQQNLQGIRDQYLNQDNPATNIYIQPTNDGQPKLYVNDQYLMSITQQDTNLQGTTTGGLVEQLEAKLPDLLAKAKRERQPQYRNRQYWLIAIATLLAIAAMVGLNYLLKFLISQAAQSLGPSLDQDDVDNQRHQLHDLRVRLMPLFQVLILAGVLLWALGRFPETRDFQQQLLSTLKVPIIIGIIIIVAYIGIRISYALVDKLVMRLTDNTSLNSSRRTRLRISTLSSVAKNIINFVWIGIGLLIALSVTSVNLGLLLASVGVIGLALSLAARNLVQGVINGFFIVLEDQFAIGDVVRIGSDAGIVENLNLRITQLRDTEGRLITIPTGDITRVANYSLHWSQADLKIPVHYNTDINKMIEITRDVGEALQSDPEWSDLILEDPKILGVDDFGDSAVIIRVWIKTQPMKQWDVSREYRRRFKQAVGDAGSEIPFPQRDVWLHPSDEFRSILQSSLESIDSGNSQDEGNGHRSNSKTDAQPRGVPEDGDADHGDPDGGDYEASQPDE